MEERPLIVVGSGPAGTATALHLHRHDASLSRDVLLLDKARHPRDKVCAGGLIPHTLDTLRELDIPLDVPNVIVHNAEVFVPGSRVLYRGRDLCRVIRRFEFDALLARKCSERGIEVRGGEKVLDVVRENGKVRVETDRGSYRTPLLVGADGSGSLVRRRLFGGGEAHLGRAIMCDVPVAATQWPGHGEQRYDFSFLAVAEKLAGYTWAFPCLIGGEPHVNVGVYSVKREGRYLYDLLGRELEKLGTTAPRIQAFPIQWYRDDAPLAGGNALLVGDAAGVDPLMGEGISFCMEYGRIAAEAIASIRGRGAAVEEYARAVRRSWMSTKLRRLGLATRLFYGSTSRFWFAIASKSRRGQELGIRWYNGVDGIDRMTIWEGLRTLGRMGKELQGA